MSRGFFAIGIYHPKREVNVGSLWRTGTLYGASFIFTVGARYRRQSSDTPKTPLHTPLLHFPDIDALHATLPYGAPLVGVELAESSIALPSFSHPQQVVYLLGAEDHGLPEHVMDTCHALVQIPTPQPQSMNVAAAGSIVLYDRATKAASARLAVAS